MSSLSAVAAAAAALSIHLQVTVLKGGQAKVLVTVPDNAPPHKRKYHSRGGVGWMNENNNNNNQASVQFLCFVFVSTLIYPTALINCL
jgi:hypothetical protein